MRNGLLIDYELCTGCQSCEVACQKEHGFEAGTWGIRVLDEGPWEVDEKTMNWNKIPTPRPCAICALTVRRRANFPRACITAWLPS